MLWLICDHREKLLALPILLKEPVDQLSLPLYKSQRLKGSTQLLKPVDVSHKHSELIAQLTGKK